MYSQMQQDCFCRVLLVLLTRFRSISDVFHPGLVAVNNTGTCTSIRYTANYESQPLWIISQHSNQPWRRGVGKALIILALFDQTRLPHSQITSGIMIGFGFILQTYIRKRQLGLESNPSVKSNSCCHFIPEFGNRMTHHHLSAKWNLLTF